VRGPDGVETPARIPLDRMEVQARVVRVGDELVHRLVHPPRLDTLEARQGPEPVPAEPDLRLSHLQRHAPLPACPPSSATRTVAVVTVRRLGRRQRDAPSRWLPQGHMWPYDLGVTSSWGDVATPPRESAQRGSTPTGASGGPPALMASAQRRTSAHT